MTEWGISNNRLSLGYFPFIDGVIGNFSFKSLGRTFTLEVVREDLGEICVYDFLDVERYAVNIRGEDIISGAEIFDIMQDLSDFQHPSLMDSWRFLYENYGESSINFLDRRRSSAGRAYLLDFCCNMGGRIAVLFQNMTLSIRKI